MKQCMILLVTIATAAAAGQTRDAGPRVAAEAAPVATLRLRPAAAAASAIPTLGEVLDLSGADEALLLQLSDQPLFTKAPAGPEATVTHVDVAQRLRELRVNPARVLVGGAARCRISLPLPEPPAGPAPAREQPTAAGPASDRTHGNSESVGTVAGETSLAGILRQHILDELRGGGGTVDVAFERAGADFLELTSPPWEFAVRSVGNEKLGARELSVTLRRDGRVERAVRIGVRVTMVKPVVVARRPLNAGATIRADDLALEERLFDGRSEPGADAIEPLVGQQVRKFIPAGSMVRAGELQRVDLVKRARPVTVLSEAGGVQLRVSGVALESGTFGEMVRVRLGEGRREAREIRCQVTGVGTVRMPPAGPAATVVARGTR
jgi:flagella basal body P-ring formation protein FlgA